MATVSGNSISLKKTDGTAVNLSLPTVNGSSHRFSLSIGKAGLDATAEHMLSLYMDHQPALSGSQQYIRSLESLDFGNVHGFNSGDAVVYSNAGGNDISGLTTGGVYYVIAVNETTIRLAQSRADALATEPLAIEFDITSSSDAGHSFSSAEVVDLGYEHTFLTGDAVVYDNGGGSTITGLVQGNTYFVINVDSTSIKLAATAQDAMDGKAIVANAFGDLGASHSIGLYFDPSDVDGNLDMIDFSYAHSLDAGQKIRFRNAGVAADAVGDLVNDNEYYVVVIDQQKIKLANSQDDALKASAPVEVIFVKQDLGTSSSDPIIVVDGEITITLNTNENSQTTAIDLVNAINNQVDDLMTAMVTGPDDIVLSSQYFGDGLMLTGNSADSMSDGYDFRSVNIDEPIDADATYVIHQGGRGVGQLMVDDVSDAAINAINLAGILNYAGGSVSISSDGSISSILPGQLIKATDINFESRFGGIGDSLSPVQIEQGDGLLNARSFNSIQLNAGIPISG